MKKTQIGRLFLGILQFAAAVVFLILVVNNFGLRREVDGLRAALRRAHRDASSRTFRAGERVDGIPLRNLSNEGVILNPRSNPHRSLIAVVDPACSACGGMARELQELQSTAGPGRLWVISLGGQQATETFATEYGLESVTYRLAEEIAPIVRFKLSTYPQVLVLGPPGVVLKMSETLSDCVPVFLAGTRTQVRDPAGRTADSYNSGPASSR